MSINKSSPHEKLARGVKGLFFKKGADTHRSMMKSTTILSCGTLSSRVLGFFRDIILAKLLGTGFRADAFFVALKIPNLFRDLVGEGAVNAAVVPVFAEYLEEKNKIALWRFFSVIVTLALMVLSAIVIVGFFLAPYIVRLLAPGFISDPSKLALTIHLTKIMFPYLIFIGLTAYSMGILYTFRSFMVPAFSPCLLNISIIASAFVASRMMAEPVFGLAIGVLIGGVLQLVVQIPPLRKTGLRFRRLRTLRHPGAFRIGKLLVPRIFGSGVYQLTVLLDTFCASLSGIVGAGGISAIYYANRIVQFPMGVFSVAVATAMLPTLSGMAQKKDMAAVKKTIVFSLENIFFIMCPTTVVLLLLSTPIVRVLFQRGEFGVYSTKITSSALLFYAIGLFSFGGIKILVTAFYALQDTKTPVKVAAFCLLLNAGLNFTLMFPLKIGGIALASAIAGTVDFLILFYLIRKRLGCLNSGLWLFACKVFMASLVTAALQYVCWSYTGTLSWLGHHEIVRLFMVGTGGFMFFEVMCLVLRIKQARKILEWLGRGLRFREGNA